MRAKIIWSKDAPAWAVRFPLKLLSDFIPEFCRIRVITGGYLDYKRAGCWAADGKLFYLRV